MSIDAVNATFPLFTMLPRSPTLKALAIARAFRRIKGRGKEGILSLRQVGF
jgi:hypothetical protein